MIYISSVIPSGCIVLEVSIVGILGRADRESGHCRNITIPTNTAAQPESLMQVIRPGLVAAGARSEFKGLQPGLFLLPPECDIRELEQVKISVVITTVVVE